MNIRPLHQSVRPSPVFLAVIALTVAGGVLAWLAGMERTPLSYAGVFILVIAGWLVSLCLHEFGHAFTAWRFGDHDVAVRGYLTLNPFKYSHPLLSLGLPVLVIALGGIGLPGGAVYVRTSWMTARQKTLVSLAGPAANLVLAVLLLGITRLFAEPEHAVFWSGLAFLGFLQVTAVVLNLLPVPGLDGYGALEPHLSPDTQRALEPAKQWGLFILLILLFTPVLNRWFFSVVFWFVDLSGVPSQLVAIGSQLTRFWSAWL
ncbi:site-2 protease family protein [Mycolicibacterium sp. HK-90]|uniref:site-2 protease family protein n=1 Tax=Mycolicibacterium sp. HK-90 TaxID=3056937 RepID=UPI00265AD4BE|nr:site-2 protease family protein [Mycolicibacterium sp. HK-90]WKG04283.1 site-2 protease family protein [Mycolicibacterium sp. HK-90]